MLKNYILMYKNFSPLSMIAGRRDGSQCHSSLPEEIRDHAPLQANISQHVHLFLPSSLAGLLNSLLLRYLSRLDGFNLLWKAVFCLLHVKVIFGPLSPTVEPKAQCDDGK